MTYHLAQINIGRTHVPLDHPDNAEFVAALGPINALAEASPGFVWRLVDDDGGSSSYVDVDGIDDPSTIVNYSVWTDVASLRHFVNRSGHAMYLRRRREWFEPSDVAIAACWWFPAGDVPPVEEAYRRVLHLREHGPTDHAWPLHEERPPPG